MTVHDRFEMPSLDQGVRVAANEVGRIADEIESVLDARHHCLLHRLRLAAETLGAMRATSSIQRAR